MRQKHELKDLIKIKRGQSSKAKKLYQGESLTVVEAEAKDQFGWTRLNKKTQQEKNFPPHK